MTKKCSFIAAGDMFVTRKLPEKKYEGFNEIRDLILEHDIRFVNLETTIHTGDCHPSAFSGGTWAMAEPQMLDNVEELGFNLLNTANNHSTDYSQDGVLETIRHLKENGFVFAGTGKNLFEASQPAYLETSDARVALIATSSTFSPGSNAGNQSLSMTGRPGLNPLRYKKTVYVEKNYLDTLREIADKTGVNASHELTIKNGFALPDNPDDFYFNGTYFKEDSNNHISTVTNKKDLERIEKAIIEGKTQADYVLVSIHSHEFSGTDILNPAEFCIEFCHRCIEAGADAIIGHGPHELRGIEIYKGKPIFYSMGNFLFESDTVSLQPSDAYENANMAFDTTVGLYMNNRSKNETSGFVVQPNIWKSVLASFSAEEGKIKEIKLYPITLDMEKPRCRRGLPSLSHDKSILEHLSTLSKPFGTKIEIKGDVGFIRLDQ